ncbi:hypothetical protein P5P86_15400 [Nocardioides sp. BP30]|uniref:hypothetical protein n=1 Tax=Nocardioides sp. BP30 TaxID=3036374 RepID=UPI002468CD0E|nr:hypothetical protein [Nocardioides sp. BP30]WGL51340.1 hypothetical protein P5P86_15400 [Nocardioides sp. BP30]
MTTAPADTSNTMPAAAARGARTAPASRTAPAGRPTPRPTEWLLTARHAERRFDGRRAAWGPFHIRRNGEHRTACGQPSVTWHTFWELRMDTHLAQICKECAAAARAAQR